MCKSLAYTGLTGADRKCSAKNAYYAMNAVVQLFDRGGELGGSLDQREFFNHLDKGWSVEVAPKMIPSYVHVQ